MDGPLRCHRCRDVIGSYEPMVVIVEGKPRTTSRGGEPDPVALGGECYHEACYGQSRGEAHSAE